MEKWAISNHDALASQKSKATKNGSRNVGMEPGEAGPEVMQTNGEEVHVWQMWISMKITHKKVTPRLKEKQEPQETATRLQSVV